MAKYSTRQQGMTLLEVMVALVIFATAAIALMNSVTLNVRHSESLSDSLQAGWVAENLMAEAMLAKQAFPESEQQGRERMGNREWHWRKLRVNIADGSFVDQVDVFSADDEQQPVLVLRIASPEQTP